MSLAFFLSIAAATALASAEAAEAQPESSTETGAPSDAQRIAQASSVGHLLYTFDRAAWVSTDALLAAVPKDQLSGVGGYVVESVDAETLRVTYYRGHAAAAQAIFVADVREGKVVRRQLLAQPAALTPAQSVLARAREVAAERARERGYKPCTSSPFNTVVLPSRDNGPVAVYLLSARQEAGSYPMGGNYRVVIAPDGKVLASRPYSVSCLKMALPELPAGATPVGLMVTHLLDPVPTELHVFASYSLGMNLFVGTADKRVWQVRGSEISLSRKK